MLRSGSFGREQREDERLQQAWKVIREIERQAVGTGAYPPPYFMVRNNLVYQVTRVQEELMEQLLVPRSRTQTVVHLAHQHPQGGYLALPQF